MSGDTGTNEISYMEVKKGFSKGKRVMWQADPKFITCYKNSGTRLYRKVNSD